jgi:hypothetical protein
MIHHQRKRTFHDIVASKQGLNLGEDSIFATYDPRSSGMGRKPNRFRSSHNNSMVALSTIGINGLSGGARDAQSIYRGLYSKHKKSALGSSASMSQKSILKDIQSFATLDAAFAGERHTKYLKEWNEESNENPKNFQPHSQLLPEQSANQTGRRVGAAVYNEGL